MTNKKPPKLLFGRGHNTGFTPAGISAFDDLRPEAVVRELVQNSLDACRVAGVEKTKVIFRLDRVHRDEIPGIEKYKEAFNAAMEYQKSSITRQLPGQAKNVANRIKQALDKSYLDVLSIIDNGIGLNSSRMDALLSDGVSVKEKGASGTFGNGHFTAVPASDLRYILYGGVTKNNDLIGSGHAILASHIKEGDKHLRGADGFFIRDFKATKTTIYDYATGKDVPDLIRRDLNRIKSFSDHGTTVLITAFNNFLETESLWDLVAPGAAANFFIALVEDLLEIEVEDIRPKHKSKPQTLNSDTLEEVLINNKENKKRTKNFISGFDAYEAYQAYSEGSTKYEVINTKAGKVDAYFHEKQEGRTRIDLCRNGMWITSNIPTFRGQFTDRMPFHLVLTLDANCGSDIHELIRLAEGPLHDSINLKRLDKKQSQKCRNALKEIRDWVLKFAEPIKSDSYTLPDFLNIDFGENYGNSGNSRRSFWGKPVTLPTRPARSFQDTDTEDVEIDPNPSPNPNPGPNPNPDPNPRPGPKPKPRQVYQHIFQVVSRPVGINRCRIHIDCQRHVSDIELRLIPDEAIDAQWLREGLQ
ncbi:MAG: hypothetical protein OXI24_02305 [Candidatus Poribacteria bacterium]|nr:hypothetical protein [Candidatus Poribacteria bacterium]